MRLLRRRHSDPKLDRLRSLPLFSGVGTSEMMEVARLMDEVDAPTGKVLMREGSPGWECFLVVDGSATVSVKGEDVASIGPGSVLGEMALVGDGFRSATVTSDTDMKLYVMDRRGFSALMRHDTIARRVREQLAAHSRPVQEAEA